MNETKTSPVAAVKNFLKRNERRILVTTTVVSTTASVLMFRNVSAHNEFLKQHDLFDQFYAITSIEA